MYPPSFASLETASVTASAAASDVSAGAAVVSAGLDEQAVMESAIAPAKTTDNNFLIKISSFSFFNHLSCI